MSLIEFLMVLIQATNLSSIVHARDTPISFAELHEKLINKELALSAETPPSLTYPAFANPTYSRHNNINYPTSNRNNYHPRPTTTNTHTPLSNPFKGKCQWCNIQGHTLSYCPTFKNLHPSIHVPIRTKRTMSSPHMLTLTLLFASLHLLQMHLKLRGSLTAVRPIM